MVLRLDPRYPLVWRSPSSIQLGVDPPRVIVDNVTETQERLLAALVIGVSESGLRMLAGERLDDHAALLDVIADCLELPGRDRVDATVAITGSGALVGATADALARSGCRVLTAASGDDLTDERIDLAVIVAHYVLPPESHGTWLRRDVVHVPVVFSDTGVSIGPVIEPGSGPCLHCLELHRRDGDAAWVAVATQLLGRRALTEQTLLVTEAVGELTRVVLSRLRGYAGVPTSVRIAAATGEREHREWWGHPECGCRGLPSFAAVRA